MQGGTCLITTTHTVVNAECMTKASEAGGK